MDIYVRLEGKIHLPTLRGLLSKCLIPNRFIFSKSTDMSKCSKCLLIIFNYIICILEFTVISNIFLDFLSRGTCKLINEGCPVTMMLENCRWKNWLSMQSYDGALLSSLGKDQQAIFHITCYSLFKIDKWQLGLLLAIISLSKMIEPLIVFLNIRLFNTNMQHF